MKHLLKLLVFSALMATLVAVPAFARGTGATASSLAAATGQDDTAKNEAYAKFIAARKKWKDLLAADTKSEKPETQQAYTDAYQSGKDYLSKYPNTDQYGQYIQKFVNDYEAYQKASKQAQVDILFGQKKYDDAFAAGRQVLSAEPENLNVLYSLARNGYSAAAAGQETHNIEAANAAKKAIQLIEAGKTFEPNTPIAKKDEVLANLYSLIGFYEQETMPDDAATSLVKALQLESPIKKSALPYIWLASSYDAGYKKLAQEYQGKCATDNTTTDCMALSTKLKASANLISDALARAISYGGTDPNFQTTKTKLMASLTNYYKYTHDGSDTGLNEYIAGITAKPLPSPTDASSSMPTTPSQPVTPATSSNTGTKGTTATPSNLTTPSSNAKPATTTQPGTRTTPTTTKPANSKPSTSSTPKTKSTKSDHRRP